MPAAPTSPFVCGGIRTGQGRAPNGWVTYRQAGDHGPARWWCTPACLAAALLQHVDPAEVPEHGPTRPVGPPVPVHAWEAIAELGRASGTGLSFLSATPDRLDRAHRLAQQHAAERHRIEQARLDALRTLAQADVDAAYADSITGRPDPTTTDVAAAALALTIGTDP